jgi:hypothetical protein
LDLDPTVEEREWEGVFLVRVLATFSGEVQLEVDDGGISGTSWRR